MPRPLNQKDTSCVSLEAVAPPRTETNEVLEGLRAERPQDTSWHLLRVGPPESRFWAGSLLQLCQLALSNEECRSGCQGSIRQMRKQA